MLMLIGVITGIVNLLVGELDILFNKNIHPRKPK